MRKLLAIGLLLVGMIYAMPVLLLRWQETSPLPLPQESVQVDAENEAVAVQGEANPAAPDSESDAGTAAGDGSLPAAGTITVETDDGLRTLALDDYVLSVVAGEIAPTFPIEAIRAQAVAARTYAVCKREAGRPAQHPDADVCGDPAHCAAFVDLAAEASARWGDAAGESTSILTQAVQDTAGQILTYENEPILAVFSAASGPKTEAAADVWGTEIPYLVTVDSPGGEACPKYTAAVTLTADEVREKAAALFPSADLSGAPDTWFRASERSPAGGIVTVSFGGIRVEGTALRSLLGLNSTNFTVETEGNTLTFHTIGYGHGVGLSQWGARYMADGGSDYREILAHYYPGTTLVQLSDG